MAQLKVEITRMTMTCDRCGHQEIQEDQKDEGRVFNLGSPEDKFNGWERLSRTGVGTKGGRSYTDMLVCPTCVDSLDQMWTMAKGLTQEPPDG